MSKLLRPDVSRPGFKLIPRPLVALIKKGICPFCVKEIKEEDFTDELSKKEYSISGTCQKCQDEIFNEEG